MQFLSSFYKTILYCTITLAFLLIVSGKPLIAEERSKNDNQYLAVNTHALNMRVGPGTKYSRVKVLRRGTYLGLTHTTRRGWVLVQDSDGTTGWVFKKYTRKAGKNKFQITWDQASQGIDASELESAIERFIDDSKRRGIMYNQDKLSLIIKDLYTGKLVASINPKAEVKAASLIKVPILQAYMIQRYRKKIRHTKRNQRDLIRMIRYSNNRSTNRILKLLGGPWRVRKILQSTGLYQHLKLVEYIPRSGRTYLNKISAEDLDRLFIRLWDRQILGHRFSRALNEKASRQMLYLLGLSSRRGVKDRLKDGTCFANDRSAKIWNKTGFVRGLNGDVGIIEIKTPKGRRPYTIISIIDRPNYRSIRGNGNWWAKRQSRLHRKISEMSYAYFKRKYGARTKCGRKRLMNYISDKKLVSSAKSS
ncbi:MAG: serine hydrolase [SAR324 cluster bacterium]|nr:serine hydrolase [SAR324 cluster bacterium]